MSIEEQNQKKINLSFSLSKALNSRNLNHRIFIVKKMKRNGLLEKKQLKLKTVLRKGRWTKEEHIRFIKACLLYGSKWRKVILLNINIFHVIFPLNFFSKLFYEMSERVIRN